MTKIKPELAPAEAQDDVKDLVDAPEQTRGDATTRARNCAEEIGLLLQRYNCRILPRIDPDDIEPVGLTGDKIQIKASYWVAPLAE